jgi:hypothetical protein
LESGIAGIALWNGEKNGEYMREKMLTVRPRQANNARQSHTNLSHRQFPAIASLSER